MKNYDSALTNFIALLQNALTASHEAKFPGLKSIVVTVKHGRKYDKVITTHCGSRSVYCFVNRETGGLLKGCWKRPVDLRERGNIYNSNPLGGCNMYGIDYIKFDNSPYKF